MRVWKKEEEESEKKKEDINYKLLYMYLTVRGLWVTHLNLVFDTGNWIGLLDQ